jgi:hypothetical protein
MASKFSVAGLCSNVTQPGGLLSSWMHTSYVKVVMACGATQFCTTVGTSASSAG